MRDCRKEARHSALCCKTSLKSKAHLCIVDTFRKRIWLTERVAFVMMFEREDTKTGNSDSIKGETAVLRRTSSLKEIRTLQISTEIYAQSIGASKIVTIQYSHLVIALHNVTVSLTSNDSAKTTIFLSFSTAKNKQRSFSYNSGLTRVLDLLLTTHTASLESFSCC